MSLSEMARLANNGGLACTEADSLQLSSRVEPMRFLLKGGESGAAIVPGDHAASLLYQRLASGEMPPGKKKISPVKLECYAKWIDACAATQLRDWM